MNCGFWLFGCSLSAAVGALPQLRARSCIKEEISPDFCEASVSVCMWRSGDTSQGPFLSFHPWACDPVQAGRLGDRHLCPRSRFINLEIDCKNCSIGNWYEGGNTRFDSSPVDGLEDRVKNEWQVSRILARCKKIKEGRNVQPRENYIRTGPNEEK